MPGVSKSRGFRRSVNVRRCAEGIVVIERHELGRRKMQGYLLGNEMMDVGQAPEA